MSNQDTLLKHIKWLKQALCGQRFLMIAKTEGVYPEVIRKHTFELANAIYILTGKGNEKSVTRKYELTEDREYLLEHLKVIETIPKELSLRVAVTLAIEFGIDYQIQKERIKKVGRQYWYHTTHRIGDVRYQEIKSWLGPS